MVLKRKMIILTIFLLSAVITVVACIGVSSAWFTSGKAYSTLGTTSTIDISLNAGSSSYETAESIVFSARGTGTYDPTTTGGITASVNSDIPVYMRMRYTLNWVDGEEDDYTVIPAEGVNSYLNLTIPTGNSGWNAKASPDGWYYYGGSTAATIVSVAANDSTVRNIISKVNVTTTMPYNLEIRVYVEVVQANTVGLTKFAIS